MKPLLTTAVLYVMLGFFSSCEKVIDIKLSDASKKYVIEGNITNEAGGCRVAITQTKSFSGDNDFTVISGAIVSISDNGAAAVPLPETSPGQYTSGIAAIASHVYTLHVDIAGQAFSAASVMPALVNEDSVYAENRVLFGDSSKVINVQYKDPPGKGNAYHFILFKNNVQERTVFVTNDDYTNGNNVTTELLFFNNDDTDKTKIKTGDTVKVTMESVDTPVYQYWFSIDAATGESNNATPANPVSNITGGSLGYFSAHTTQSKTITVQ